MKPSSTLLLALVALLCAPVARAQNGLSDDRVSLPDGPGSIGGVGENTSVNANRGSASFNVPIRLPAGATPAVTVEELGRVGFPYAFPEPGAYRLWVQVRHGGVDRIGAFDVTVRPKG